MSGNDNEYNPFDNGSGRQLAIRVDQLADNLTRSFGPHHVAGRSDVPRSIRARSLLPPSGGAPDVYSTVAAQMVGTVMTRMSDTVGAGTLTAVVLAQAIFSESVKAVTDGADPVDLCRGLEAALDVVLGELRRQSRPLRELPDLARMATVQAQGDERLGTLIAEAIDRVGSEGAIALSTLATGSHIQWVEGLQLDGRHLAASFPTSERQVLGELVNGLVLLCDWPFTSPDLLQSAHQLAASQGRPLLAVAPTITPAVSEFVEGLGPDEQVCVVEAPGVGAERAELLDDIAILCGGRVFSDRRRSDVRSLELSDLGRASATIIERDRTTFIGGAAADGAIQARVRQIRAQLEDAIGTVRRRSLDQRLARFVGGVAVIPVGGDSPQQLEARMLSVGGAVVSVRAAFRSGTVPGGGVALLRCLPAIEELVVDGDQGRGVHVMCRALREPLRQIVSNSGGADTVVNTVRAARGSYGYNAATNRCEDLTAVGVVDPTAVVRAALMTATSVTSSFLVGAYGTTTTLEGVR